MKTRSFDLIWLSCLTVIGLTLGWLAHGGATVVVPPTSVATLSRSARSRELRPIMTEKNNKWQNFAIQFPKTSEEEKRNFEQNIAPKDRKAAIEALLAQGGPQGFDNNMEDMIVHLLNLWGEENFEEVWIWGQQIKGQGTQNFVSGKLLNLLVSIDLDRAANLYFELSKTNHHIDCDVPQKILARAALINTEEFLKLAKKVPMSDFFYQANFVFAQDFNFRQVADTIARLRKNKDDQTLPMGFPENFSEVWIQRDHDKAFTGAVLTKFIEFPEFLKELEEHDTTKAAWIWVADKIQESEVASKAICSDLHSLHVVSFNGIVQALPDAASRDRFLIQVVQEHGIANEKGEMPSIAISAMSSPEVRLEAFSQMRKHEDQPDITKVTDLDLQNWGVTRQQIAAIFSAP
jgi:hypothetical protein